MNNSSEAIASITYTTLGLGVITLIFFIFGDSDSPPLFATIVWYVSSFAVFFTLMFHLWNSFQNKDGRSMSFIASFVLIMFGFMAPIVSDQIHGIYFQDKEITEMIILASFGLLGLVLVTLLVSLRFKQLWYGLLGVLVAMIGIYNISLELFGGL